MFYLLFWRRLNITVITRPRPTRFLITAWAEAILVLMVVVTKSVDRAAQINYFFVYSSECLFRTPDCVLANEISFFSKSVDRERELPVHCECELPVERELLFCIQFRVQDTGLVLIIGFCYIRKCTIYFSRPKCVKSGVFRPKIGVRSFA